jgi:hypothetical protein
MIAETFKKDDQADVSDKTGFLQEITTKELIYAALILVIVFLTFSIYRYYTGQPIGIFLMAVWFISIVFNIFWKFWYRLIELTTHAVWCLVGILLVFYALTIRSALYVWHIIEMALGWRHHLTSRAAAVSPEWAMFIGGFREIEKSFSTSDPGSMINFLVNAQRGWLILLQITVFYLIILGLVFFAI